MKVSPYIVFDGQAEAAFDFYAEILRGKITTKITHGATPMADHVAAEWHDKIMHIQLDFGDNKLMGSDAPPEYYEKKQGFSVQIEMDDLAEAERVFNALADGGTVKMPFGETFWALRFGMVEDKFGTPWMINCYKPA